MLGLNKLLVKVLRDTANKIEADNCDISESEAMEIINALTHEALSKESACEYLNVSRATFDLHVSLGNIPRGKKRKGFKELVWYKDELQKCINRLKH
jgi:hypothetical protein